jgi:hypothetical protein
LRLLLTRFTIPQLLLGDAQKTLAKTRANSHGLVKGAEEVSKRQNFVVSGQDAIYLAAFGVLKT